MIHPLSTIGLAALSHAGDFQTSYELARRVIREGTSGDFVECGVFGGSQCAAMAKAICDALDDRPPFTRRVHLFDSFEGVPEPGEYDKCFRAGGHVAGASACSLEAVQSNMRQWGIPDGLLVYHPGWFEIDCRGRRGFRPTAEGEAEPRLIALLRLDLDLYEGTAAALAWLYGRLAPGGFCVVDDYGLDGCRKAVDEFMQSGFPPITWQKP